MTNSMNILEHRAVEALGALIKQVPALKLQDIKIEDQDSGRAVDILAHVDISNRHHVLACEVKASGQPRHVRMALLQLSNYIAKMDSGVTPIFIAPYLSPEAQALCREQQVGFLDLQGNARLVFDGVFIERSVSSKPSVERRELKSIFKPKSAQVLRVMLRDPNRPWRVTELAKIASVSLGHVSNVRSGLLDREWAQISDQGLFISKPDALLDAWRDAYEPDDSGRVGFYTTLHGNYFEDAARRILHAGPQAGRSIFASYSAANWIAPYARTGAQYFYSDDSGLEQLKAGLKLSSVTKGENVVVTLPKDDGVFLDTVEPARGAVCTSPIQTYLDLTAAGERGQEAAEHLRRERLTWPQ